MPVTPARHPDHQAVGNAPGSPIDEDVLLPDHFQLTRSWLSRDAADDLLAAVEARLSFSVHRVRVFGRMHDTPRETAFQAPIGVRYRYSGHTLAGEGLPDWLQRLIDGASRCAGVAFDSVLVSRYRDGEDRVGWHADDEAQLGPDPVIAVLSLGASRDLSIRRRDRSASWTLSLGHGDLLVMRAGAQRCYQHAVPRRARAGRRISLSLRKAGCGRGPE